MRLRIATRIRELWQARAPRERMVVAVLACVLGAALYVLLVQSAGRARTQLRASITVLQSQASRVEQQAGELERLRGAPPATPSQTDLRTQILTQARAAGLPRDLLSIDAQGDNQVKVSVSSVAFPEWLAWVAALQAQQVRLDACRIEALTVPGIVSATATFARAKPQ